MKTTSVAFFILSTCITQAQIEVIDNNPEANQMVITGLYRQNFDSLTVTPKFRPWSDNSTLPGWYITEEVIGPGIIGGVDSWGTVNGQGDRAFGPSGGNSGTELIAVRFANATSLTLTGLSVAFDGEQWYRNPSITPRSSTLRFEYQIFDAGAGYEYKSTGWVSVPGLDFISPNAALTTAENLDGNAPENSIRDIQALIDGVSIAPTQEIWLRWVSYGVALGIPVHGQGIDNLSVSFVAIPEPAAFAGLAGLGALAFGLSRRRARLG